MRKPAEQELNESRPGSVKAGQAFRDAGTGSGSEPLRFNTAESAAGGEANRTALAARGHYWLVPVDRESLHG